MKPKLREPPKLARALLLTFLRHDLAEDVCGDLEEHFYLMLATKSLWRAQLNYWYQVIHYVRPFAMRSLKPSHLNHYDMFQNYFKITTRNLFKQKFYSLLNIGGLSIGLSVFMLISFYVQHEYSYDNFYANHEHLYRIYQSQTGNTFMGTDNFAVTPSGLAHVLEQEYPEVEAATSIEQTTVLLSFDNNQYWESGISGDDHFFKVFQLPLLLGSGQTALSSSTSLILTASLAKKIFGDNDPIGKLIKYRNEELFTVTGVIADPPTNSSLQFTFISNILSDSQYAEDIKRATWNGNSFHTFFMLAEGTNPGQLEEKLPALLKKYQDPKGYEHYPFKDKYFVQPLSDMHLTSHLNFDIGLKGNERTIYLLSAVAFIILLLACVNYMNLAVARSMKRAREVGLRKVVGAVKKQIILQFMVESVMITSISTLIGLGVTYLLLPVFGDLMERRLDFTYLADPFLICVLIFVVVAVGILSGSYPAFIMSSLRPIEVLKAKVVGKNSRFGLQRLLIIGQYAASLVLVITSLVIYRQMQFINQKELGYDKNYIVTIDVRDRSLLDQYETLASAWKQNPNIIGSTLSSHLPTNITSSTIVNDEAGSSKEDDVAIYECRGDHDFLEVFGINLLAGRSYSREIKNDDDNYIINETAAKAFGWTPTEAIGKQFVAEHPKTIIGVIKDFHMHSMHLPIAPLMIKLSKGWLNFISVKVSPDNLPQTIAFLETSVKKYTPYPFHYQFLDQHFDQLYKNETKLGEMFGFFTVISMIIASLGLFGLAAFASGQRTKEIGIRKVLGASAKSIVILISKDFLLLVGIAFLVSVPLGWFVTNKWLEDFAYKVQIEWWIFAIAGMIAFFIANISLSFQSVKASLMDPVESLRSE